jgi:DNA-binding SARP family transcriptional activator
MLRLTMLGTLSMESDHGPPEGVARRRRPLALLAFIAASGSHGVSRDKVLAYLWPESDTGHARNCLKQTLFALRRDLGRQLFLPGASTLRLDPQRLAVDRWEFERALDRRARRDAVDAYRGPFLDGFHLGGLVEFERWVEAERARLARRYQVALEALAAEAERAGDWVWAVEWWGRLAEHDPFSSQITLGMMRALVRLGDRAEALRCAELHERLLREELGVRPDTGEREFVNHLRGRYTSKGFASAPELN